MALVMVAKDVKLVSMGAGRAGYSDFSPLDNTHSSHSPWPVLPGRGRRGILKLMS